MHEKKEVEKGEAVSGSELILGKSSTRKVEARTELERIQNNEAFQRLMCILM